MIPRYSKNEMAKIWSNQNKFSIWINIECLIAEKLSINGTIPKIAAKEIRKKAKFNIKEIENIEKKTKHDFVAFINNASKYIGSNSKYFHHGVTSSDVIDTAFSIQLRESSEIIIRDIKNLMKIIKTKALKHKNTVMIGRSHGVHAELTTFGLKLASFYSEFNRNLKRMENAKKEISICAISGPVGTYNSINPNVEEYVAKKLNLKKETISSQIIPRDRHAVFFSTLGIIASSIERFAIEIRHLQRTEVLEVEEFFNTNQKGSSAMPHKRNPVLSENLTGLARYIRSLVIPAMENVAVWHERDISHSSVERIIAPDSTILVDFAISRLSDIIKKLTVYPHNMKNNLSRLGGLHNSQNILLALSKKGLSREKSYKIVQSIAMESWKKNKNFEALLQKNKIINKYIPQKDLTNLLKSELKIKNIDKIFTNVFKKI